jgi:Na+/H+-dicarboxylate symporter
MKLFQKVLIGFVLGAILGAIWGPGIVWIKPIGTAGKTIAYYLITTAFAIIIGLLLGNIFQPGAGMNLVLEGPAKEAAGAPSLVDTIVNLIPKNPIGAMAEGKVLQVIVFALFFGYAMTKAGEKCINLPER